MWLPSEKISSWGTRLVVLLFYASLSYMYECKNSEDVIYTLIEWIKLEWSIFWWSNFFFSRRIDAPGQLMGRVIERKKVRRCSSGARKTKVPPFSVHLKLNNNLDAVLKATFVATFLYCLCLFSYDARIDHILVAWEFQQTLVPCCLPREWSQSQFCLTRKAAHWVKSGYNENFLTKVFVEIW